MNDRTPHSLPWWQTMRVRELSPLNPDAVALAQLAPPFQQPWHPALREIQNTHYEQLFWLQWYAMPLTRRAMMRHFSEFIENWQWVLRSNLVSIHPETSAEWRRPAFWRNINRMTEADLEMHKLILHRILLPPQVCQAIDIRLWTSKSLAWQALQSRRHGDVMAGMLAKLPQKSVWEMYGDYCNERVFTSGSILFLQSLASSLRDPPPWVNSEHLYWIIDKLQRKEAGKNAHP